MEVISVLSERVGIVRFGTNFSLESNAFLLPSADLVSHRTYFSLIFIIAPILFIQQKPQIFYLFPEGVDGNNVLIMSIVVIIILHEFLILDMSVFLLDCIELVSESKVVLISLLNLKDFCFELGNKEIFLITSEMD